MSSRRKISVELPKRPSVFERLGTKPGMPQPKLKQSSRPKTNKPGKEKHAEKELPSADDRLLPKKAPVVKEPEKIPKDLKKKRVKRPRSRSSSSSSSSSGSSSSSSSSSDSSSSSEDEQRRKRSRKRRRSGESRRRGGASRDKSRSPQRKRRDKKRLPPAKKVASKKVPSSPARSKASSVPAKKRRSNSGKGKGGVSVSGQQSGARASVRRSTSRGRKRSRSRDGKPTGGQRHHSVSPKVRSRSPRRGSPGGGGGSRKRTPSPRRRASRSPMRASVGSGARRDGSRRRSVERGRQARSPARQLGGFDRRAVSTSRERVGGDRKDRRSLPRSSKQLDPPVRSAQVERVWEEPARLKDEDVRRRRDDPRDRQWPARPPSDYGREPLPYEEVPLLPPRRFSPGPVRGDGRRPPLLAPPCGDDRLQRPPPYGRHGPDERRSMDRLLPPRADEWMPYDDGAPPIPPPPPPPPAVGRGMPRGGRDWSSPGRGPGFRRGAEPWGGPMPRMNRGGFRRGGGGGGGFHGGAGGGGGGPSYYDPESELEPPPDPGDMIVRDEVRSEEGGSGPEDETASPAADRRSDVVPESSRTSREQEPPQPPDVWSGGKEPWTSKVGPSGESEAGGGAAAPAAGSEPTSAAVAAEPAPVPELNLQAESLSDFSDDADEILNREDEVVEEEITFEDDSGQDGERAGSPGSGSARLTSGEQLPPPPPREMSSGEADPEPAEPPEPKPQSLVDALAIDWSSLVSSRPLRAASPPAGTALERFSPAVVFAQLGVCSEWAGPQLVQRVAQACSNGTDAVVTPSEPVPGEEELQRRYLKKGEQMLSDPGPYRRALCTKADLAIRRHLCEVTETEPLTGAAAAATFKRDTFTKHLALLTARVG